MTTTNDEIIRDYTKALENLDCCREVLEALEKAGFPGVHMPKKAGTQPNEPLTMEELREMDGEPVWVVSVFNMFAPSWMIVNAKEEEAQTGIESIDFERYGVFWLAYLRKQEEET